MLLNEQCLTIPQPISFEQLPIKQGAQLNKKALRWAWAEKNVSAFKSSASVSPSK